MKINRHLFLILIFIFQTAILRAEPGKKSSSEGEYNLSAKSFFVESPASTAANPIYLYRIPNGFVIFEKRKVTYQFLKTDKKETTDPREKAFDTTEKTTVNNICINWAGSLSKQEIIASEKHNSTTNYILGNNPAEWKSNLVNFNKLLYKNLYSGIDLQYSIIDEKLKYELIVHNGADLSKIKMLIEGADGEARIDNKTYSIKLNDYSVTDNMPFSYQLSGTQKIDITTSFIKLSKNSIGFIADNYNKKEDLIIDPFLYFSTYVGGSGTDAVYVGGIDRDATGNIFLTGRTFSTNFPVTPGSYQTSNAGNMDGYVFKINPSGSAMVYSTYFGGTDVDAGYSLKLIQSNGSLWVVGGTYSSNFPVTAGVWQTTFGGGSDAFLLHLNANGNTLLASTYFGGANAEYGHGLDIDQNGDIYVAGETSGTIYTTPGCFQSSYGGGSWDGIFFKFHPSLTSPVYASYIGGTLEDVPLTIRADATGNAYIAGWTAGANFPVVAGSYDVSYNGGAYDAFVAKVNPTGSALLYSTYIGSPGLDRIWNALYIDAAGRATVAGYGGVGLPTTAGVYNTSYAGGNSDVFVSILSPNGSSLVASCLLGGVNDDLAYGLNVDNSGNIFITGISTTGYPTTTCTYDSTFNGGTNDAFVSVLNSNLTSLLFSSFLGGNDKDIGYCVYGYAGHVIVSGETFSSNFPTTAGSLDQTFNGASDVFVTDIDLSGSMPPVAQYTISPATICLGDSVNFNNLTVGAANYFWDFGDGNNSILTNPAHTYLSPGKYYIKLIAFGGACSSNDTLIDSITISAPPTAAFTYTASCNGQVTCISSSGTTTNNWNFNGQASLSGDTVIYIFANPTQGVPVTLIAANSTACADTLVKNISFPPPATAQFTIPDSLCGLTVQTQNNSSGTIYHWNFGDGNSSILTSPSHTYSSQGTYSITLIADSAFCADTISKTVSVFNKPVASYTLIPDCNNGVSINNQSVNATGLVWNMGNGVTVNGALSNYTYSTAGSYTVTLITSNANYCFDTLKSPVTLSAAPTASFNYQGTCEGVVQFQYTGTTASSYHWDFGNGDTSVLSNPTENYLTSGNYPITLIASNGICVDTSTLVISILPKPVAAFSDSGGCSLNHLLLSSVSSIPIQSYQWNLNGNPIGTTTTINYLFPSAGTYNVQLIEVAQNGCSDTIIHTVKTRAASSVQFTPLVPPCGNTVQFTNTSTNTNYFNWSFGDGNNSSSAQPQHIYALSGNYTVTLVADTGVCADSLSTTFILHANPVAAFTYSGGCTKAVVTNQLSLNYDSLLWIFGDGNTAASTAPVHTYTNPGQYNLQLIATTSAGCSDTTSQLITISPLINYSITASIDSCEGKVVYIILPDSNYTDLLWDFGDNTTSNLINPSHSYQMQGSYPVVVVINQGSVCADTISTNVEIAHAKNDGFFIPNCFSPNDDNKNDRFCLTGVSSCRFQKYIIFNRWGAQLFEAKDITDCWDGKLRGVPVPEGVYTIILIGDENFIQTLTVLR